MNKTTAQTSTKKLAESASSLEPSALISLFEIDITELLQTKQRVVYSNLSYEDASGNSILRFHNNIKLVQSSIWFDGKEYFAAPIRAEGFETSAKGSPPSPKLSITINYKGLPPETLNRIKYFKMTIRDLDDLIGAKVTRIKTFAKYLDKINFYSDYNSANPTKLKTNLVTPPEGYDPDPNAYFPHDIFYIDRKSSENKNHIELELASPFDTQEIKLPARVVTEKNCVWTYRGEGCCYEYTDIKQTDTNEIHYSPNGGCKATSNNTAPPIANDKDEIIRDLLQEDGHQLQLPSNNNTPYLWDRGKTYQAGQVTRILLKGINYFFVSKVNNNVGNPPPNDAFWYADKCSKKLSGCRLRWKNNPILGNQSGPLPFGAFPTSRRSIK
tara:strand:- start:209 stop:1360 length:1152 start_codon:yes stop_codon:yes gene_type:complete